MSTDLYLVCSTHGNQSDEVGNAHTAIVEVRKWVANRAGMAKILKEANEIFQIDPSDIWDSRLKAAMYFFSKHSECDIELMDEYGKYYDLSTEPEECWAKLIIWPPLALGCMRDAADNHTDHIHENPDVSGINYKITWRARKKVHGH